MAAGSWTGCSCSSSRACATPERYYPVIVIDRLHRKHLGPVGYWWEKWRAKSVRAPLTAPRLRRTAIGSLDFSCHPGRSSAKPAKSRDRRVNSELRPGPGSARYALVRG